MIIFPNSQSANQPNICMNQPSQSMIAQSHPTVNNGVGTNQQTITSPSICLTQLLNRHCLIQVMEPTTIWQLHLLQTTSKYPIYVPNGRYSMQVQQTVIHIPTPIWCQRCHNQPKAYYQMQIG